MFLREHFFHFVTSGTHYRLFLTIAVGDHDSPAVLDRVSYYYYHHAVHDKHDAATNSLGAWYKTMMFDIVVDMSYRQGYRERIFMNMCRTIDWYMYH